MTTQTPSTPTRASEHPAAYSDSRRLGIGFLAAGVPALLAATTMIVAVDLPTKYDIAGYQPPVGVDVAYYLGLGVLLLAPPVVGLVLGWRLGLVAILGAMVAQAVGIFGAMAVGDPLAKMLEPRSFQLYEAIGGSVGVGIVVFGWFVGLLVIRVTGALSRFARGRRGPSRGHEG